MVPSITRQAILIKCKLQSSVMIGNYEFYYGAGLLIRLMELEQPHEKLMPKQLAEWIAPYLNTQDKKSIDEKLAYLVKLLRKYVPTEQYDEQMDELFKMGITEEKPWEIQA